MTDRCIRCHTPENDRNLLSRRGLCVQCSAAAALEAAAQMSERRGERYERWLASRGPTGGH